MNKLILPILVFLLLAQVSAAETVERSIVNNREYLNASNLTDRLIINLTPTSGNFSIFVINETIIGNFNITNITQTDVSGANLTKNGYNYTFTHIGSNYLNTSMFYGISPLTGLTAGIYIINGVFNNSPTTNGTIIGIASFIVTNDTTNKLMAYDVNLDNKFQEQEVWDSLFGYFNGRITIGEIVNAVKKYVYGQKVVS